MLVHQLHHTWLSLTPWALCAPPGTPREPEQLALPSLKHGYTSAPDLCSFYFQCFLQPSMPCVPFLEEYTATEFQVAFHWVTRLLSFVATHTASNTTQFFFLFITHRAQSQPQQLGYTALHTTPPTLEPLECTTAHSQQCSVPSISEVSTWLVETFGRGGLW